MSQAERLLQRWHEAGLLDEDTAARIRAFEEERRGPARPYLFYALGGLGALSIAVGMISIVAANWDEIPPGVKLGCALALLAGLAAGTEATARRAARRQGALSVSAWGLDVLVFLYYGATLASISLVAQVYQMGGKAQHALALWSLVTAPLLALGRGRLLMAVWLVALQGTWLANVFLWVDDSHLHNRQEMIANCSAALCTTLAVMAVGAWPRLRRARPQLCSVAQVLGMAQWLVLVTLAQQLWYERGSRFNEAHDVAVVGLGGALLCAALVVGLRRRGGGRGAAFPAMLMLGTLSAFLPTLIPYAGRAGLVGAFTFLGLWALIGWYGLRAGSLALFNAATAVIAVRLLIIYFEVFGSLLNTGLGLLSGGLLTLFMAWVWLRKVRRGASRPAATPVIAGGQP